MTHRQDSFTGTVTTITWHFPLSPGDLLGAGRVISPFQKKLCCDPIFVQNCSVLEMDRWKSHREVCYVGTWEVGRPLCQQLQCKRKKIKTFIIVTGLLIAQKISGVKFRLFVAKGTEIRMSIVQMVRWWGMIMRFLNVCMVATCAIAAYTWTSGCYINTDLCLRLIAENTEMQQNALA